MFSFQRASCGEVHTGIPAFGWEHPVSYLDVPAEERSRRCELTSDTCTIDGEHFFVRGCLDIPVRGQESMSWGVWVSLSGVNFRKFLEVYDEPKRSHLGPFFGWLNSYFPIYPDTVNLKTQVHLRDGGLRPYVELEPTEHPLAIEQCTGITTSRVAEIYQAIMHRDPAH